MIELIRRLRINDRIPTMYYNDSEIRDAYRKDILIVGEYDVNPDPSPYAVKYFCIESLEDNNTITFTKGQNAPNNTYYVSIDLNTWTEYYGTQSWTINTRGKLYFKAVANKWCSTRFEINDSAYLRSWILSSTKTYNVTGNIMSLLYGDDFAGQTTFKSNSDCFGELFKNSDKLINANKLVLPATTLIDNCYEYMFQACTSLVTTPILPAMKIESNSYCGMFSGCTSLVNAPALPATDNANYQLMFSGCTSLVNAPALPAIDNVSYLRMFQGCTSLVNAPALPATSIKIEGYRSMFRGCTSLVNAPQINVINLTQGCFREMFYGCTSLINPPQLNYNTLTHACYMHMFYNCTSLTTAPELPANQLVSGSNVSESACYYCMFYGCTNLNYVKCLAKYGINSSTTVAYWLYGVSQTGTFVKDANATWPSGASGIPSGWTVVDYVE